MLSARCAWQDNDDFMGFLEEDSLKLSVPASELLAA